MRNGLLILVAILAVCAVMLAPAPADAGNCGLNGLGTPACHSNGFATFGSYNPLFTINGVPVVASQPPTVFLVAQGGRHTHRQRRQNFDINNFQGREFRQEIRRGPLGRTRSIETTVRR